MSIAVENREPLVQAGGCIAQMVEFVKSGNVAQQEHSLAALWALAAGDGAETRRVLIAKAGGIAPVTDLAKTSKNDTVKANAAGALWRICIGNADNQARTHEANAIPPLIALCKGTDSQKLNAIGALRTLSVNEVSQKAIVKAGGIAPIDGDVARTAQMIGAKIRSALFATLLFSLSIEMRSLKAVRWRNSLPV